MRGLEGMRHSTPEENGLFERHLEGMSTELIPRERYDRLLELALDLYDFAVDVDALGREFMCGCTDFCDHEAGDDGCARTGECWYKARFRELGVEVDE